MVGNQRLMLECCVWASPFAQLVNAQASSSFSLDGDRIVNTKGQLGQVLGSFEVHGRGHGFTISQSRK